MINYSIIIPHKNCFHLLERLLKSIPERDDVQIIVVDDNSDAENIRLLKLLNRNKAQIEIVYTTEGRGAGYARNIGVQKARGNWLIFSDSDDLFTENLEDALNTYVNDTSDIVFFSINCLDNQTFVERNNANQTYFKYIEAKEDTENLCRYKLLVPWAKFVKRKLVIENNIRFDETKVGNDAWFSLQTGFFASRIKIDSKKIYNWLVRDGSLTTNHSLEARLIHFNLAVRLNKFKEENGLYKYRTNLFIYFPMLKRVGMSYWKILSLIIKNTDKKFLISDFLKIVKHI